MIFAVILVPARQARIRIQVFQLGLQVAFTNGVTGVIFSNTSVYDSPPRLYGHVSRNFTRFNGGRAGGGANEYTGCFNMVHRYRLNYQTWVWYKINNPFLLLQQRYSVWTSWRKYSKQKARVCVKHLLNLNWDSWFITKKQLFMDPNAVIKEIRKQ